MRNIQINISSGIILIKLGSQKGRLESVLHGTSLPICRGLGKT